MKVAIPTRDDFVDNHFGHCAEYTIYTTGDNHTIFSKETLPSPQGCGCKSNIASVLQEMGVTVLLAGNMGTGALNVLSNHGIQVYRGCSGSTDELIKRYLSGAIDDSGKSYDAHEEGHECGIGIEEVSVK